MHSRDQGLDRASIVICDRQPVFAKGLATLLKSEARDYEVVAVTTSLSELEVEIVRTHPDVVLLDALFGVNTLYRIRNVDPDASVILLGSSETQIDLTESLSAGACAYLLKHDDVAEICDVIRVVLRGYSVVPSALLGQSLRLTSNVQRLSETERRILALLARGATNQDIAHAMHFSERTVRRYLIRIYSKLCVADRIQAALYAVRWGLVNAQGGSDPETDPPDIVEP
jgi:two-component system nitrate/nitrite response regulator NarL